MIGTRVHSVSINGVSTPRPVLETRIEAEGQALVLFVCHWKSKIGDEDETEETRKASARVILRRIRELLKQEPELPVIIMGDLNENYDEFFRRDGTTISALLPDNPGSAELAGFSGAESGEGSRMQMDFLIVSEDKPPAAHYFPQGVLAFYSPWTHELKNGSYYYKGNWETIDHFLISDQLFNNSGWDYENCVVIDYPPFTNSGGRPVPYSPKTGKGLSDHLPLLLTLRMQN
jgi:endonuclease/exonuclease/phosphatase family metal-dependent hydrolase